MEKLQLMWKKPEIIKIKSCTHEKWNISVIYNIMKYATQLKTTCVMWSQCTGHKSISNT